VAPRRTAESADPLVDEVLLHEPMATSALAAFMHVTSMSVQREFPRHFLFASQPKIMGKVLAIKADV